MLQFIKQMSLKNQIWFLSSLSSTLLYVYFFFVLWNVNLNDSYSWVLGLVFFFSWLVSSVLAKVLIEKNLSNLGVLSEKIRKSCKQEGAHITQTKDMLLSFIQSTGQQLDNLRESERWIENVTHLLKDTSLNADECRTIATKVTRDVTEGYNTMQSMAEAVQTIEKTKDDLSEIASLINKISNDTSAIHNIVTTTELLSLNASIEAARAGEAGKGFSVVAEEVGILAKNSGREAKEIEQIVAESQKKLEGLVEQNQNRVEQGKKVSADALSVFASIKDGMSGISSRSENIRSATIEQKLGVEQVNCGSEDIKTILKKNISDSMTLLRVCKQNEKNFKSIEELSEVLQDVVHSKKAG